MEKNEVITHTVENVIHNFYCDDCNKYLGKSQEYDDGYYAKFGEFELKIYMPNGWYSVKKCLCDTCRDNYVKKVEHAITELGFKKQ